MKNKYRNIICLILMSICIIGIFIFITSCSSKKEVEKWNSEDGKAINATENVTIDNVIFSSSSIIENNNSNGRKAYITFDDGPGDYTDEFLELFDKENIKVTYFCTYDSDEKRKRIKKIFDKGHTLGIHSYRHKPEIVYVSEEAFLYDILHMQKMIYDETGFKTRYIRFPFGSSNSASKFNPGIMTRLTTVVHDAGFEYYDWNVYGFDASDGITDPAFMLQKIKEQIENLPKKVDVTILCHDTHEHTLKYMPGLIKYLKEEGYSILPITDDTIPVHLPLNN